MHFTHTKNINPDYSTISGCTNTHACFKMKWEPPDIILFRRDIIALQHDGYDVIHIGCIRFVTSVFAVE